MGKVTFCGIPVEKYTVCHGDSEVQVHGAEVLRSYLEKINGEALVGGEGIIRLRVEEGCLGADGYRIRNHPGEMEIVGSNGRGLLYGIYGLLEKYLGFTLESVTESML